MLYRANRKKFLIPLAVILLLLVAYYLGWSSFTNRYIVLAVNPFIQTANHISYSLSDFFSLHLNAGDLSAKNKQLAEQLVDLAQKNIELELLRQENDFLKKELNFLEEYQYNYLIARVLGRDLNYQSSNIIINQGLSAGLKEDLAITSRQGVIIGKIVKVENNLSYVRLLKDNASKLAVVVMADHPVVGIANGQHNINLSVNMLPKDTTITPGDLVATSGLEPTIPPGLLVGHISKTDNPQEKFWQGATIEPAIDYSGVQLVTVILPVDKN